MNQELNSTEPFAPVETVKLHRLDRPKKTFFFERMNGEIFAAENDEAFMIGNKFKLVGVGSGQAFYDHIKNCGVKGNIPIEQAREIMKGAFEAELAVARGHFERPTNPNAHFDNSFPQDQRQSFRPPR